MILPSSPRSTKADDETMSTACLSPAASTLSTIASPIKRKERRRRIVSFASEPDAEFPAAAIFEEDIDTLWLSREEFRMFKSSYSFIVKLVESKQCLLNDEEMCTRGLEARTRAGCRRKRQNVENSIDAVLYEQERQWESSVYSTRKIASLYRQSSAQCAMTAYLIAQKDAKTVLADNERGAKQRSKSCSIIPLKKAHPERLVKRSESFRSRSLKVKIRTPDLAI